MGGIVIDIWDKMNFFGSFGSQKGAKNAFIFVQGGLLVGLTKHFSHVAIFLLGPLIQNAYDINDMFGSFSINQPE